MNGIREQLQSLSGYLRHSFYPAIITSLGVAFLIVSDPAPGAELLPFPNAPASQRVEEPPYYRTFRNDISGLSCSELNELSMKLTNALKNAKTTNDIEYYSGLIKILDEYKINKCK